jgi:hypothetical protein
MHGNNETPRFVGALACLAARNQVPVRVAVEIQEPENATLERFLSSEHAASSELTRGALWSDAFQSGRSSMAMIELFETLRGLRAAGADIKVIGFDDNSANRDRAMAQKLLSAFAREPAATYLVLSGNLHARRTAGDFNTTFMAAHLANAGVKFYALNAHYGSGTTWACSSAKPDDCGPMPCGGGGGTAAMATPAPALRLERSADGAYDGVFEVGAPSFSPPAAKTMSVAQAARLGDLPMELAAYVARQENRYQRCGDGYHTLGARQSQRAAHFAYRAAACYALAGDRERAFAELGVAATNGFAELEWASEDDDLASLRSDPRWSPFIERMKRAQAPKER